VDLLKSFYVSGQKVDNLAHVSPRLPQESVATDSGTQFSDIEDSFTL